MFNWKNLFKKRVDPKDIPVLDDIVDETKNQKQEIEDYPHLFSENADSATEDDEIIINLNDEDTEDDNVDENNVVILSSVIGENNTDVNIDEIDNAESTVIKNDDTVTNEVSLDPQTEDAVEENIGEIDNPDEEQSTETDNEITEENITNSDKAETDDSNSSNETTQKDSTDNYFDPNDPEKLEIMVNRVVEQLKPEIERQLHDFVKNSLTEKSPEEFLKSFNINDTSSSDINEKNQE